MAESDAEKTEKPTGRRLAKARDEGQVPRSRELSSFLVLLVAASAFWLMGGWLAERATTLVRRGLTIENAQALQTPHVVMARLEDLGQYALISFAPLVLGMAVAALLPSFLLHSWVFSTKAFTPKFGRMNPISGLGRLFSKNSLVELVKSTLKSLVVGGVAVLIIRSEWNEIFGLLAQPLEQGLASAGHLLTYTFLMLVASMLLIVVVDVPWQIWQYFDNLKMTKEEVKQEAKESEGNPQVKGRIRRMQLETARRRMMAAVPQADVIVTNPSHFAVALSYKENMAAPKVLAKGMGEVARRIKEVGLEHGVPLLEAPPLARALYRHAELEQEIPGALYAAVAEVLAYVYQLDRWRANGGDYPLPPKKVSVPPDFFVPEAA
ncbi:MAG: flagellar type III secretion system protein FlhB [Zoogloeaceae bacterium]|jgi:flagellar biosynthetic protein FlhB|nr:flagellar type III secretion system protein FlhB [Zoogloeaceae bacterium]